MNLRLDSNLIRLLELVQESASGELVYLVGGAVRDLLVERPVKDLDFVLAQGSIPLAKTVCRKLNGSMYVLDDARRSARVILRQGKIDELILDFTSFIGNDLEEDLRQRDFTINAIAIGLGDLATLIDPLNGQADLASGLLRLCGPDSLTSDPLRVLRGVRLVSSYGLEYEPELKTAMRVAIKRIGLVSGERIRDELFKCFAVSNFERSAELLMEFGILDQLRLLAFGVDPIESGEPQTNSYRLSCLTVLTEHVRSIGSAANPARGVNAILPDQSNRDEYRAMLDDSLQGGRKRQHLLTLCSIMLHIHPSFDHEFSDKSVLIPELFAEQITRMLLLGQREKVYLQAVTGGFIRLIDLSKSVPNKLSYYRFFREFGSYGLDGALLALVEIDLSQGESFFRADVIQQLFYAWFTEHSQVVDPPQLVDGNLLQRELGIGPGSQIGRLLETIREQQVLGNVQSTAEAIAFARGNSQRSAKP